MCPVIQAVEPRHFFTAVGGDPAFGTNGSVGLASGFGTDLLASHGAIYVEHFNARRGTVYLSKYTDAGVLDTAWGDGGSVRPTITRKLSASSATGPATPTESRPVRLIYDVRTGGVLLATDGGRSLTVERFTADGHDDMTWGNAGVAQYTAPRGSTLKVGKLLPVSGKRLAVAFTQSQIYSTTPTNSSGTDSTGTAVLLTRFDRLGRADRTFNAGRPVVLRAGHQQVVTTISGSDNSEFRQDFDTNAPSFGDLRATGTGYRLVTTRNQTTASYHSSDATDTSGIGGRTQWTADAYTISTSGAVVASDSAVIYRNAYGHDGASTDVRNFSPLAVTATSPTDAVILARSDRATGPTYRVLRVSAGELISDTKSGGDLTNKALNGSNVSRNADGVTFVLPPLDGGRIVEFTAQFSDDPAIGGGGAVTGITSGTGNLQDLLITADDAGHFVDLDRTPSGALTLRRLI